MVGVVNYPNWLTFARISINKNKCPRVAIYINIRLFSFHFSLCKDIIDQRYSFSLVLQQQQHFLANEHLF